jgi:hypothetical protein
MKCSLINTIVVLFLALVSAMHLLRMFFQIDVAVAGITIPQWPSIFGFAVPAGLAFLLARANSR